MSLTQMPKVSPSENEIMLWIDGIFKQNSKPLIYNEDINDYPSKFYNSHSF